MFKEGHHLLAWVHAIRGSPDEPFDEFVRALTDAGWLRTSSPRNSLGLHQQVSPIAGRL